MEYPPQILTDNGVEFIFSLVTPDKAFYAAATLCLLSMHSHFNSTYMYILPQIPQLTGAPAH